MTAETKTIRIGTQGTQTRAVHRRRSSGTADPRTTSQQVVVNGQGQLGTSAAPRPAAMLAMIKQQQREIDALRRRAAQPLSPESARTSRRPRPGAYSGTFAPHYGCGMAVSVSVGVSDELDPVEAFDLAAAQAAGGLGGHCDLAIIFVGAPHLAHAKAILSTVHERLEPRALIGCGAGGVLGGGRELETGPGAAVWALSAPRGADRHPPPPGRAGRRRDRGARAAGARAPRRRAVPARRSVHVQRRGAARVAQRRAPRDAGARWAGERRGGRVGVAVPRRRGARRRRGRGEPRWRRGDPVRVAGRHADRARDDDHRLGRQRDRASSPRSRRSSGCARRSAISTRASRRSPRRV